MGNNCTSCCNSIEKKLKQIQHEDENELKIQTARLLHNHKLSMIVEDAYESQLSQQNSHLGLSLNIQSNTMNSITTGLCTQNQNLISYWILDIQERYIIVSNINEPNLFMKILVTFNEQTEEYCLFEELAQPASNSTNGSLSSFHNVKNQVNMNNTNAVTATNTTNNNNSINNTTNNNSNNNSNNNTITHEVISPRINNQQLSSDQIKFIANKKQFCYPFERQISQFYHLHFEKSERKLEKIYDFQAKDDVHLSIIDTWKEVLLRVFKMAGIQQNSNLIIVNNFLRFTKQINQFSNISEMLLRFVFENLKCSRFSVCSSGTPILKFINRKNGIVFDILDTGHIYCIAVQDGITLDSQFRIIYYCLSNFYDGIGDNINDTQTIPTATSPPNTCKKNDYLSKDVIEFLDSLDPEYVASNFRSRSIAVNNQCKNETIITSILQILNNYYISITPSDDSTIITTFQPILPKQPRNTRMFGTIDLLKLNVIETISKSKYDRLGAVEILKQNIFL